MRTEPTLDTSAVLDALRRAYGLPVDRLTFFTTGWVSYCYKAQTADGASYLLKLYDESMPTPLLASSRDFYLPLTHWLCTQHLFPQIACPVQARDGSFSVCAGPYRLILFHFIEGEPVGFGDLPDNVLVTLAGRVGQLHKHTRNLEWPHPLVERFEIAFEDALPSGLADLAHLGPGARDGLKAFADLLLPRQGEILEHLGRLKELQSIVQTHTPEMVVCHTDLHGGNLLVDGAGKLYILDWEGALLSPPEQDLFFFAGHDTFWDLFLPNYEREFGPAQLDVDLLGFYYYRRGLEDVGDWILRMLHTDQSEEQDRQTLYWTADTLAGLPNIQATLSKISAHMGIDSALRF